MARRPIKLDRKIRTRIRRPVINVRNPTFERPPIIGEVELREEAAPLLLLPMQLEYRVVTKAGRPLVAKEEAVLTARAEAFGKLRGNRRSNRKVPDMAVVEKEMVKARSAARTRIDFEQAKLASRREIWFRWYPDGDFALEGIAPGSEFERSAMQAYIDVLAGRDWWAPTDADAIAAWQEFTIKVGAPRAVHLMRSNGAGDADWAHLEAGRIVALPNKVSLYAIKGKDMVALGSGKEIMGNSATERSEIAYTPDAIEPGGWLAEFGSAVDAGMGLKLTDRKKVDIALDADWIVAIGLHGEDACDELDALLRDGVANGNVAILPQDSPTNNAPSVRTQRRNFRDDPLGFLEAATPGEKGLHDDGTDRSAQILADALGVDIRATRQMVNSADTGFEDARAMLRVIGPALLDETLDGSTAAQGIDENTFIDILATAVVSRGMMPSLRIGKNAFGIVTMTDIDACDPDATEQFSADEKKVLGFLRNYARFTRDYLVRRAEKVVPRITPGSADNAAAFEAMIQNSRVSRRVEVTDAGESEPSAIGCFYVRGSASDKQPQSYLRALRTESLSRLPDPTESDFSWPLLYRLARLSLTRNMLNIIDISGIEIEGMRDVTNISGFESAPIATKKAVTRRFENAVRMANAREPARLRGRGGTISDRGMVQIRRLVGEYQAGLRRLEAVSQRENGTAQLETLMMEVFDLFQHRVDAWATGVAAARLRKVRASGKDGVSAGYFSFLGKLRDEKETVLSSGYLQAPSSAQATTAAILRSARDRHAASGAFDIDLSSRRIRRAMLLLQLINQGNPLSVALGLRAERLLRDLPQNRSDLAPYLRTMFPVRNAAPPEAQNDLSVQAQPAGARKIDGLALIDAPPPALQAMPQAVRTAVGKIVPVLKDDMDALADLVVAEAVHHRAMGAIDAANAWMQVLSGETVPGRPMFPSTTRTGHRSTHRIVLALPLEEPNADPATTPLRALAEPTLAALAQQAAGNFGSLAVTVSASRIDDPQRRASRSFELDGDLGMAAIDLLIGGAAEVDVRSRAAFQTAWREDQALATALAPDDPDDAAQVARPEDAVAIEIDLGAGQNSVQDRLDRMATLAKAVRAGRAVEPRDLNGAADAAAGEQTEGELVASELAAAQALQARIDTLLQALQAIEASLDQVLPRLRNHVVAARTAIDNAADDAVIDMHLQTVEQSRRELVALLPRLAETSEPGVLRKVPSTAELIDNDQRLEEIRSARTRLQGKIARLAAVGAPGSATILAEARALVATRREALQGALDGEALPILPPVAIDARTTPALGPNVAMPTALDPWADARRTVKTARDAAALLGNMQCREVLEAATLTAQDAVDDPRSEAEAPRSRMFGAFLSPAGTFSGAKPVVGLVLDEWVESRAAATQAAAMTVNYNAPQSQAPNAMILCVPPDPGYQRWSEQRAVAMVKETIDWMRVRALTTEQKFAPIGMQGGSNMVQAKRTGTKPESRIPKQRLFIDGIVGDISGLGMFTTMSVDNANARVGVRGAGFNLTSGFAADKDE